MSVKIRGVGWVRLGLGLGLLGVAAAWASVSGPAVRAQNFGGALANLTASGLLPLPPPPPEGAWGEVIMANARWIVIQNHQGQQFPIAMDSVRQFLVRWPTSINALTNASLVEAIGADFGSNVVSTTHIDVFEGSDQTLVSPGSNNIMSFNRAVTAIDPGFNRYMNGFDIAAQNQLYGWAYPVNPGIESSNPAQLHIVGNAINLNPLQIGLPGNNSATIVPAPGGNMTMSQVTRGSSSFAQKGDVVFLMPTQVAPKSLVLAQLVLYKKIPRSQFAP
jgi:hypothetical protein